MSQKCDVLAAIHDMLYPAIQCDSACVKKYFSTKKFWRTLEWADLKWSDFIWADISMGAGKVVKSLTI